MDGFRLVLDSDDKDGQTLRLDAVEKLQWGSFLCGSVLHSAPWACTTSSFARRRFGMDHSSTHTALLPFTLSLNFKSLPTSMQERLGAIFGGDQENPAGAIWDLQKRLRAPTNIRTLGFSSKAIDDIARKAEEQAQKSGYKNPRPVKREDIAKLLTSAHLGRRPSHRVRLDDGELRKGLRDRTPLPVALKEPRYAAPNLPWCACMEFASAERILKCLKLPRGNFMGAGW